MEPDDSQTIFDLREVQCPEKKTKYEGFWAEAEKFLNEDIGTAVDDRRHCQVTHLATAVSVLDFRNTFCVVALKGVLFQARSGYDCSSDLKM